MERHEKLRSRLADALKDLDVEAETPEKETIAGRRRRRGNSPGRLRTLQFVERDGLIVLREGRGVPTGTRRASVNVGGEVIEEIPFKKLGRNDVKKAIDKLDKKLTGRFGLFPVRQTAGRSRLADAPIEAAPETGKILLLVHGTFSNNETTLDNMQSTDAGRSYLAKARGHYDHVLAFNHRTLGVSPMINARELYKAFRGSKAEVDVICHSRGGLVTRCWLESMDFLPPAKRKVVFVGSPLAGTSLAAPPNLRGMLNLLGNIGNALGKASAAVPFLAVASGLFQVFSSVTSLIAKTPIIDAAVGLVPGLDAQSRVGNNRIILSFRTNPVNQGANYFAVQSNFEPEAHGWRFWRNFRNIKQRAINLAADPIFDGPNDLVVDTESMASLADELRLPDSHVLDFGKSKTVHHTNYFQQAPLYDFIRKHLGP